MGAQTGKLNINLKQKMEALCRTLAEAQEQQHSKAAVHMNPAFKSTLAEVMENLTLLDYQTTKYANANAIKKKII